MTTYLHPTDSLYKVEIDDQKISIYHRGRTSPSVYPREIVDMDIVLKNLRKQGYEEAKDGIFYSGN